MKVYISADMEGITGVAHWDEVDKTKGKEYEEFRSAMTQEVRAVCEGVLSAGAQEIVIKDAHWTGRNLILGDLPPEAKVIRGWSGNPLAMIQEIDSSFAAALFVGYHSGAGIGGNPLSHTMNSQFARVLLNEKPLTEFLLNAYGAQSFGVPVCFVSGDSALTESVRAANERITTVATGKGVGNSMVAESSKAVAEVLKAKSAASLKNRDQCHLTKPESFRAEVFFKEHQRAYRASHYPGAKMGSETSVKFESRDILDVMRLLQFV